MLYPSEVASVATFTGLGSTRMLTWIVKSRDLSPALNAQIVWVAESATPEFPKRKAELAELDRHLTTLEVSPAAGEPNPSLCLEEGGDSDDELRLRAELPVRTLLLTRG